MKFYRFPFLLLFIFYSMSVFAEKSYFKNISHLLPDQSPRLSYGVAVSDFDNDGNDEFIVTGFRYSKLIIRVDRINIFVQKILNKFQGE